MKRIFRFLKDPMERRIDVYEEMVLYATRTEKIGYLQRLIVSSREELDKTSPSARRRRRLERLIAAARQELARLYGN